VRCFERNPVNYKTWRDHQNQLAHGVLGRYIVGEEKKEEEDSGSEEEEEEADGEEDEKDSDEAAGDGVPDIDIDIDSAEYKFAAQVVAEVANGGSSQTSAGNFLKIMYQYVRENLPDDVDFPKTWYMCEKLGKSQGTHTPLPPLLFCPVCDCVDSRVFRRSVAVAGFLLLKSCAWVCPRRCGSRLAWGKCVLSVRNQHVLFFASVCYGLCAHVLVRLGLVKNERKTHIFCSKVAHGCARGGVVVGWLGRNVVCLSKTRMCSFLPLVFVACARLCWCCLN
jgi:hypothetical protein